MQKGGGMIRHLPPEFVKEVQKLPEPPMKPPLVPPVPGMTPPL